MMQQQPKMGGKEILRLFLKGNDDLADALLSREDGGSVLSRGLPERIAEDTDGKVKVEVMQETAVTVDVLLQQLDGVPFPQALRAQGLDAPFITGQFGSQILQADADAIVLSIQSDLLYPRWRHQGEGYLVCPPLDWQQSWSAAQRDWFMQNFSPLGKISAAQYRDDATRLVQLLKEQTEAHVILLGVSSYDPHDGVHNFHRQEEETLTMRVHRLNLAMLHLSVDQGVTFVDVDRLLAELGCDVHVPAALQYSETAYDAICGEFLRVMTDVGFFEERPLLVQMGQRSR